MPRRSRLLTDVLRQPDEVLELTPPQWDLLIRQARATGLLAQLAWRLERTDLLRTVPPSPRQHLKAARRRTQARRAAIERHVARLRTAMAGEPVRAALLRGAAYADAGALAAEGRDEALIELLLLPDALPAVTAALRAAGWAPDDEAPGGLPADTPVGGGGRADRPCWHWPAAAATRWDGVPVASAAGPLPATLQPEPIRLRLDLRSGYAERLLPPPGGDAVARSAPRMPALPPLPAVEAVLHAAATLSDGVAPADALRDLVDLDLLLREHARTPGFWARLLLRAQALGAQGALATALRLAVLVLGTPVAPGVLDVCLRCAPRPPLRRIVEACWLSVLLPPPLRPEPPLRRLARALLHAGAARGAHRPWRETLHGPAMPPPAALRAGQG